jgi:DedD protein
MDTQLRSRLIGAAILIGLAVIFVPMLLEKPDPSTSVDSEEIPLDIPAQPDAEGMQTRTLPIETAPIPEIDATQSDAIAQVNTASAPAPVPHLPSETAGQIQRDNSHLGEPLAPVPGPEPVPEIVPEPADQFEPEEITQTQPQVKPETKPETKPEPKRETQVSTPAVAKAPSADGGRFGINFGSYGTNAAAQKLIVQLSQQGIKGAVENNVVDGKTLYRVAARGYSNRARAEQARLAATTSISGLNASVMQGELANANASTTSVPAKTQGFAVQLGVFADKTKADDLVGKLKRNGLAAYAERITTASGTSHRVRVGPFVQRLDADGTRNTVKSKLSLDSIVVPYP